jgi:dTDP-3-amino-3,4,6-trideoxy-alpha-D-glucose transaminase
MKVDFYDFNLAPSALKAEWQYAISRVIGLGTFIGGPTVTKFEMEWSQYLGVRNAIGVGNGYDALVIALKTLEVGPGDFVAVPSHTFIATWLAVAAVGATPIAIDCDLRGLMDLDLLEKAEKPLAAVIPVHMHGQMVDMKRLMVWASKSKVKVIEDCAQAHGAEIHGKKSGTWGDIGAFSFYPTKNLGGLGDAGALVTTDDDLAKLARSIANYGSKPGNKYEYQYLGINSRLDPIQAAILSVNIKYLDYWNESRKFIAGQYSKCFAELEIPLFPHSNESVFHHYIAISENRSETTKLLQEQGVITQIHYPESAEAHFYKITQSSITKKSRFADILAARTLSLPMSPWISDREIIYITNQISSDRIRRSFLGEI